MVNLNKMDALAWLRKHLDDDGNDLLREMVRGFAELKGSSANLGATRLSELSSHLEGLGRARALGGATSTVEAIALELERVRIALAAEMPAR